MHRFGEVVNCSLYPMVYLFSSGFSEEKRYISWLNLRSVHNA